MDQGHRQYQHYLQPDSRPADHLRRLRRPALDRYLGRLYLLWTPEHQSAVAEPVGARSQGELHFGQGKHSLKFGYEFEYIWMEVEDSNPLYGSFTFNGAYSVCPSSAGKLHGHNQGHRHLLGRLSLRSDHAYSLSTYWISHLHQSFDSVYAQDDWKVDPELTLNLGLRWEYGSPYSERNNDLSNFNPSTGTLQTLTPGYTATTQTCGTTSCITPYSGGGVYGKSLVNPDLTDFAPRLGFAYALTPSIAVRGGYGISYIHYYRAGSGNMLAINAPNAMFTSVTHSPSPASGAQSR